MFPRSRVVVVTTPLDPIVDGASFDHLVEVDPVTGANHLSAWLNVGIDHVNALARQRELDRWEVLVADPNVLGRPDSVALLAGEVRRLGVSMAGPSWYGLARPGYPVTFGRDDERTALRRVPNTCFMLAGQDGLRCDESFRWWYAEDDVEMRARRLNGVALVDDTGLVYEREYAPRDDAPSYAAEDHARFVTRWGREPW